MKVQRLIACVFIYCSFLCIASAEYQISGKVNLSSEWQQQIFLSTINKLDDYYNADPSDIIQVGTINEDGFFYLNGDNLPPDLRFYRLYLIKEENTEFDACIYLGDDDHNFIHLILDNNTEVEIISDESQFSPFGNYSVNGDEGNKLMQELSKLVLPSFHFYKLKFQSERQFSEEKMNRDLFQFADTCENTLVALAAMISTDMDQYYDLEGEMYESFGERLASQLTNHIYTDNYLRKLNYYQGNNSRVSSVPRWTWIIISLLFISLLIALRKIRLLSKQLSDKSNIEISEKTQPSPTLTQQEGKILDLISLGKSNKEIASELFIELSTVKTHINKLYAKLNVSNRTEAKEYSKMINS